MYYAFPPQELIKDVAHRDSNGAPVAVSVRQDQSELVFQILDAQYRDTEVRLTYDALLDALQVTQANSPAPATAEEKAAFLVEMCRRLELVKLHVPGNAGRREGSPTSGARRGLYHIEFGSPQEYDASAVEGELSGAALAALAAEAAAGPQGPTFAELRKDGRRALMRGDFVEAAGLLQHAVDLQTDTADPKLWRDLGIALFEAWREEDDDGSGDSVAAPLAGGIFGSSRADNDGDEAAGGLPPRKRPRGVDGPTPTGLGVNGAAPPVALE